MSRTAKSALTIYDVSDGSSPSFTRYYSTFPGLLSEMGDPSNTVTGVSWVLDTVGIPSSAFWIAERFTIAGGTPSDWQLTPVQAKESGIPFVTGSKGGFNKPTLGSATWITDAVAAVSSFTGRTYTNQKEFGYGTTVVITYANGKLYGRYIRSGTSDTWVTPAKFIDGDLIVDGTISASQIQANTITATEIAAGAITATEIAANAVTATKVSAGAITAGKIAANAVTANEIATGTITAASAVLANAAVNTLQIAGNAVTIPVSVQYGAVYNVPAGSHPTYPWHTITYLSASRSGSPALITCSFTCYNGVTSRRPAFSILRNTIVSGSLVQDRIWQEYGWELVGEHSSRVVTFVFQDTSTFVGGASYNLQVRDWTGRVVSSQVTDINLTYLETKR
jgi:hypothetical protein